MLRTDVRIAGTEPDADQRQLATSCAVVFLASASLFIYIPELAPLLLHDASGQLLPPSASTQMRQQLYALAMSVPQLCSAVGAPILGAVSDYWGRKRSLMLAITGVMLAMLLCAVSIVSHHTTLFIAGLATIGLMDGSGVIVQAGLVEGRTAEAQAADIGKLTTWSILGIICGPLVGGLFSDNRVLPFASSVVPFLRASNAPMMAKFSPARYCPGETDVPTLTGEFVRMPGVCKLTVAWIFGSQTYGVSA